MPEEEDNETEGHEHGGDMKCWASSESEQQGDLEQVRGLLGQTRIETTQLYGQIRPPALKQAVEFP